MRSIFLILFSFGFHTFAAGSEYTHTEKDVFSGSPTGNPPKDYPGPFTGPQLYGLTHRWTTPSGSDVRLWQGNGNMRIHGRSAIVQVWDKDGILSDVSELSLPSARIIRAWAFSFTPMGFVLNVECQHRHERENAIYAYQFDWIRAKQIYYETKGKKVETPRLIQGGPVIQREILEKAGKLLRHRPKKISEQAGADEPATAPESKSEGQTKREPESGARSQ